MALEIVGVLGGCLLPVLIVASVLRQSWLNRRRAAAEDEDDHEDDDVYEAEDDD